MWLSWSRRRNRFKLGGGENEAGSSSTADIGQTKAVKQDHGGEAGQLGAAYTTVLVFPGAVYEGDGEGSCGAFPRLALRCEEVRSRRSFISNPLWTP